MDESKEVDILRLGICPPPQVVAVGQGGSFYDYCVPGGGGSGRIEHAEITAKRSLVQFAVQVGMGSESVGLETTVTDMSDGSLVVEAGGGKSGGSGCSEPSWGGSGVSM